MLKLFHLLIILLVFTSCKNKIRLEINNEAYPISIKIWYGSEQTFGIPGNPQRAVNILGQVYTENPINRVQYSLNGGEWQKLSYGPDGRRLASKGDFNIEIYRSILIEGQNIIMVSATDSLNNSVEKKVIVHYTAENTWPLPYEVHWDKVNELQKAVTITDGLWKQVKGGIRTVEPYYDRVIAIGDSTWKNFEITTTVIFHDFIPPLPGPPTFGVSHAALASRWLGHAPDNNQPHIKWYPLGVTCEFQLSSNLDSCRWRILGGWQISKEDTTKARKIILGEKYWMKHRVYNLPGGNTCYCAKLWPYGETEPDKWDLVAMEGRDDVQYGSALLIAHNTNVTFGDVKVISLEQKNL